MSAIVTQRVPRSASSINCRGFRTFRHFRVRGVWLNRVVRSGRRVGGAPPSSYRVVMAKREPVWMARRKAALKPKPVPTDEQLLIQAKRAATRARNVDERKRLIAETDRQNRRQQP